MASAGGSNYRLEPLGFFFPRHLVLHQTITQFCAMRDLHMNRMFSETFRLLKPGGRAVHLDFWKLRNTDLSMFYKQRFKAMNFGSLESKYSKAAI